MYTSNFICVQIFIMTISSTNINYRIYLINVWCNKFMFFNNNTKISFVFMRFGIKMFSIIFFNINCFITYTTTPQSSFFHLIVHIKYLVEDYVNFVVITTKKIFIVFFISFKYLNIENFLLRSNSKNRCTQC